MSTLHYICQLKHRNKSGKPTCIQMTFVYLLNVVVQWDHRYSFNALLRLYIGGTNCVLYSGMYRMGHCIQLFCCFVLMIQNGELDPLHLVLVRLELTINVKERKKVTYTPTPYTQKNINLLEKAKRINICMQ